MARKPVNHSRNKLRKYEATNLLFFLTVILALVLFVSWVFQSYKSRNERVSNADAKEGGIVSEVVSPVSDSCIFYLGTNMSEVTLTYRSRLEIPVTDDGLISGLFEIPGVVGVVVDRKVLMLQKSPSARWESVQAAAREIINDHLHLH
jgi:hypothetical protein